jgi:DNA-binding transcriptional LysR family regulator
MPYSALRRLDLNLLLVLHTVLQSRNVTVAARRLNMSQPAVSRAIGRLRTVFDDPLFSKGGHGVVPTERAEALAGAIAHLLVDLEAAIGAPPFDPPSTRRIFRIATTDYGALAVFPDLAANFAISAPLAGIDIMPFGPDVFRALAAGELDLVLYTDEKVPDGLSSAPLFSESYASVVRGGHPLLGLADRLAGFVAYPHVLVTVFGGRSGLVDEALAAIGQSRQIAITVPYFATAALIAAQSDLILTLPRRAIQRLAKQHDLVMFEPPVPLSGFGYRMVWHRRTDVDRAAVWLRARVAETVALN